MLVTLLVHTLCRLEKGADGSSESIEALPSYVKYPCLIESSPTTCTPVYLITTMNRSASPVTLEQGTSCKSADHSTRSHHKSKPGEKPFQLHNSSLETSTLSLSSLSAFPARTSWTKKAHMLSK